MEDIIKRIRKNKARSVTVPQLLRKVREQPPEPQDALECKVGSKKAFNKVKNEGKATSKEINVLLDLVNRMHMAVRHSTHLKNGVYSKEGFDVYTPLSEAINSLKEMIEDAAEYNDKYNK